MSSPASMRVAHIDFVNVGDFSIWGRVQSVTHVAPGIQFVSTDRHGGYVVSSDRLASMPAALRACSFTADTDPRYFEEDASWCAVALAWPEDFTSGMDDAARTRAMDAARMTFERYYRSRFGHLPGAPAINA